MNSAAIDNRVGTEEQAADGKASLPHQEAERRKLADRLGAQVLAVFSDDCSGQTTNRPGLQSLLGHLAEIQFVICYDGTRLGRNRRVLSALRQMPR